MTRTGLAIIAAACAIITVRLASALPAGPWWGINALGYLGRTEVMVWTGLAIFCLIITRVVLREPPDQSDPVKLWHAGLAGAVALALFSALPPVAAPLLGDGIDRIEATPAGLKILLNQPAPLDLILHFIAYRITIPAGADPWSWSSAVWRWSSHLFGAAAAAGLWLFAELRARSITGRVFIFTTIFGTGAVLFFMGYPENYVSLAAAVAILLPVMELVGQRRLPPWSLLVIILIMVGLHFFMVLLVPALLFSLHRHRIWTPGRTARIVLAAALVCFGALAAVMVEKHFRGLGAIFVRPAKLFSAYHLIGFASQQLLACPLLPLLGLLMALDRSPGESDPVRTFTGAASLTLLGFFFVLRPVIGPAADWDLFAIPSLIFTPWLALRVQAAWRGRPEWRSVAGAGLAVMVVSVGPWLSVNLREGPSLTRFRDLMEWEARHNDFAASFGYYRLGKYLARSGREGARAEAEAALTRALEINPDSATLRRQTASVFIALGDQDQAKENLFISHRLLAEHYLSKQQYAAAAREYERALDFRPGEREILLELIKLYDGPLSRPDLADRCRSLLPASPSR